MRVAWLLPLVGLACSATFDPKDGGATGTTANFPGGGGAGSDDGGTGGTTDNGGSGSGSGSGSDGESQGSLADLDDLKVEMIDSADGCQEIDDVPHPGAASYFYGELAPSASDDGTQWTGTEEWILYANESWQETGVADCVVTWAVRGEASETGLCGACDLTLAVVGTVDLAYTSCPEELWEDSRNYSVRYDIRLDSSTGDSQWFFADTGTPMGVGSFAGVAMNYLTDRSCLWF